MANQYYLFNEFLGSQIIMFTFYTVNQYLFEYFILNIKAVIIIFLMN